MELLNGDCLEVMKSIPDKSIDMVLCDLPYGTTDCKWDVPLPLKQLWEQYDRITKKNAAILLFSAQPFTTDLICSNRKNFRYEIIWQKTQASGFLNANKMPLRAHENILVFYKNLPTYNPIKTSVNRKDIGRAKKTNLARSQQYGTAMMRTIWVETGLRYPTDVIKFSNWNGSLFGKNFSHVKHPTAKPVDLLEYLIKSYSNPGDTILDNCMGSGSTGVACVKTNRDFIGIELDDNYFSIAKDRIEAAQKEVQNVIA